MSEEKVYPGEATEEYENLFQEHSLWNYSPSCYKKQETVPIEQLDYRQLISTILQLTDKIEDLEERLCVQELRLQELDTFL
jgi:hypothetical protein